MNDRNPSVHQKNIHAYRSRLRDQNDASAHETAGPAASVITHAMVSQVPAEMIESQSALDNLLEELEQAGTFAYDSEFIGELNYLPRLCLVQVATTEKVSLIDPMAGVDLRGFWRLICNPKLVKIVHAGQQDIEPVYRALADEGPVTPQNIFDTQIGAGLARMVYPLSLSKLVGEFLPLKLAKGLTFTHWDRRPLSQQQMRYAADDVRYLPAVYAELSRILKEAGHLDAAMEETAARADIRLYNFDPETAWLRIRGAGSLPANGQAILRELTIWRDGAARQADVPPRALIKDEVLLAMAREPIKDVSQLSRIRGLPRPVEVEFGQVIVDLCRNAGERPKPQTAGHFPAEETPSQRYAIDSMLVLMQTISYSEGIDPGLVGGRADIADVFHHLTGKGKSARSSADCKLLNGWRKAIIGQRLLDTWAGRETLKIHCDGRITRKD